MRNSHAGPCYRCRTTVEPGDGHFERTRDPRPGYRWRAQHWDCAIFYRGQKTPWRGVPRPTPEMMATRGIKTHMAR